MKIAFRPRKLIVCLVAILVGFALSGSSCSTEEYDKREATQQKKKDETENTQEKKNLREKIKRDEASAGKVGYVYLLSFGKFIGYYTIKGKISANGSQLTTEQDITCVYKGAGDSCVVVDGPQDDGTYGEGDPGVFFFTTEGAMVVTDNEYLYADQPIATAIEVPKLN